MMFRYSYSASAKQKELQELREKYLQVEENKKISFLTFLKQNVIKFQTSKG